jgi:adenylosuccinate lyase
VIGRYTRPQMGDVWSDQARLDAWFAVELAALRAWEVEGVVPAAAVEAIAERGGGVTPERVAEIERTTNHDVIAFTQAVAERVGADARWFHYGLTSSDVVDTALALQLRDAAALLDAGAARLVARLTARAREFATTVRIGRTHGVHAEPTTFGLTLASHAFEVHRGRMRLAAAAAGVRVGKLSGAVGVYANVPPQVEARVMDDLRLEPEPAATQVVARDRHAGFVSAIAGLGASVERLATEVRHDQRTEVAEAFEPFGRGQKGSSAMPHKRNPITAERLSGLARLLRGHAQAALENVALWHERDISHSSVERVILPDACILLDYMLDRAHWLVDGLDVRPERMAENLAASHGLVFSGRVLLALTRAGLSREDAYAIVQEHAMRAWDQRTSYRALLEADPRVTAALSPADLDAAFDVTATLTHAATVIARLDALPEG